MKSFRLSCSRCSSAFWSLASGYGYPCCEAGGTTKLLVDGSSTKIARGQVAGPALGGVLVAVVGPGWALGRDAVTFAASALLFSRINLRSKNVKVRTGFTADLREGWDDFRYRRWLWVMVCQAAVIVPMWLVVYQLLGPVYGKQVLGGAAPWGLVVSGFTAGLVAGAALALMWKPRQVGVVVCAGTGSMAVPLAAIAAAVPLPVLVVATGVAGTGLAVSMTVWASLVQKRIPADRLSRTLSYSTLGQILPVPFGYLFAGPAAQLFGLRTTLATCALIITAAAVVPLAIAQVRGLCLVPEQTLDAAAPAKSRNARPRAAASSTARPHPSGSPQHAVPRDHRRLSSSANKGARP